VHVLGNVNHQLLEQSVKKDNTLGNPILGIIQPHCTSNLKFKELSFWTFSKQILEPGYNFLILIFVVLVGPLLVKKFVT
jgi:hypothetical protein